MLWRQLGFPTSLPGQCTTNKTKKNWKNLKKTLIEIKGKNPDKKILFFDESRFGTKSKTGLAWYEKGSRTPIKVKLGFKNFYLYSSVNSADGNSFTLLLPSVIPFPIYNAWYMQNILSQKIITKIAAVSGYTARFLWWFLA